MFYNISSARQMLRSNHNFPETQIMAAIRSFEQTYVIMAYITQCYDVGPLLLTRINLNPSMDTWFHPAPYNTCDYSSTLVLKLNHVSITPPDVWLKTALKCTYVFFVWFVAVPCWFLKGCMKRKDSRKLMTKCQRLILNGNLLQVSLHIYQFTSCFA